MNDEITIANQAHWEAEVLKKNGFTVPWLDLSRDDILKYWDGEFYRVTEPYAERVFRYPEDGAFDFRHYLSDIFNGLVDNSFR